MQNCHFCLVSFVTYSYIRLRFLFNCIFAPVPCQELLAFVSIVCFFFIEVHLYVMEFGVTFIFIKLVHVLFRSHLKLVSECGVFSLCWRSTGELRLFQHLGWIVVFLTHLPFLFSILFHKFEWLFKFSLDVRKKDL